MHVTALRSTTDADHTYSGHGNERNYSFVGEILLQLFVRSVPGCFALLCVDWASSRQS
jgi:hypothetical protein